MMDVLQVVSAPSNYPVDTGGSPAQRSLRTHTNMSECARVACVQFTFSLTICGSHMHMLCHLHTPILHQKVTAHTLGPLFSSLAGKFV